MRLLTRGRTGTNLKAKARTTREERAAIFSRAARHAGATIAGLLDHDGEDWSAIEALRAAGAARLGLIGDEAAASSGSACSETQMPGGIFRPQCTSYCRDWDSSWNANFPLAVGHAVKKLRRFDLGSDDPAVLVECKLYT